MYVRIRLCYSLRMPNRTIYLPDKLDELSRRLELNLSHLTQQAIRTYAEENRAAAFQARVDAASAAAAALDIDWPEDHLARQRSEAAER